MLISSSKMTSRNDYSIKDVENVVKGIDGEIKKIDITRLTAIGENYLSLVFRVDFEVEKEEGRNHTLTTVAKRLPLGERKFDFNAVGMKNEIRWYSEILPQIKRFGDQFGIDTAFYPEYLGGRLSLDPSKTEADDESVLILENLIPKGFKNEDRYIGFDLPTAKALLKILANFHAIPLILKFKNVEFFQALKEYLTITSPFAREDEKEREEPPDDIPDKKVLKKMLEIPAYQPYRSNIEKLIEKSRDMSSMWHDIGPEPWNTIVHGDYWVNNLMVKQQEGAEPLVKLLDFQFCSYASYAKDLVFFLLSSVRNDVQRCHFDELLSFYYDQLTSILSKMDIPELRLSFDDYMGEVTRVAQKFEVEHTIFFTTIIFGAKGTGPDTLIGEVDMLVHVSNMADNISDKQKEKLGVIMELASERRWI